MGSIDVHHGLGFLISFGALPIAACGEEEGGDTNATSPTTIDTTMTASSGDDDTTTPTSDPGDTTDGDTEGEGLPPGCEGLAIPQSCSDYAMKFAECYGDMGYAALLAESCACYVTYYGAMYAADCSAAVQDMYACLAALSCEELMAEGACAAQEAETDEICSGDETTG